MNRSLRAFILSAARVLLARPGTQGLNRLLFDVSLRGMGILNYRDNLQSGEDHLLGRIVEAHASGALGVTRPVVIDVGANVGDYSARVLDVLPEADIHVFEPHPASVAALERRLGDRVTIVPAAGGAEPGTMDLFDYADGDGSSHASLYPAVFERIHQRPAKAFPVAVVAVDDYLRDNGVAGVTLLKVDTEGAELEVLKGARRALSAGTIDAVQFEFNEMNVVSRVFLRDFAELLDGFSLHRLLPKGSVRLAVVPTDEIFAYQNIVAVRRDSPLAAYLGR